MNKAVKVLFWVVVFIGLSSIIITFYNTIVERDYDMVEVE